ncbi:GrpB family protein [Microlunatus elymi]|uniref:GrpB family protein n=1 Tax=Microlunatus elymi TaxID=2596828 RepID=A0A516Q495_9ACTN|nr:GrpB family protein [Microlunatus elymi]QDP98259.1 GrpB family protein [Microlunatus elymi]
MDDSILTALTTAGLGGDRNAIRVARTTQAWLDAGAVLRDREAEVLDGAAAGIEQVGSSSVLGLLAKPIIDLAVGLGPDQPLSVVTQRLEADGWDYRGDAGSKGGHVFMLQTRPLHRLAHLHVVDHQSGEWRNYLRLRDLLRRSPEARRRYEGVKLELIERDHTDMRAYTFGKTDVVVALLDELG